MDRKGNKIHIVIGKKLMVRGRRWKARHGGNTSIKRLSIMIKLNSKFGQGKKMAVKWKLPH